jgi:hypothetical protein
MELKTAVIGMSGHCPRIGLDVNRNSSATSRGGTRTPQTHKRPSQRPRAGSVEVLNAYSHTPPGLYDPRKTR